MKTYIIWRATSYSKDWTKTFQSVKARTQKEADSKTARKFANAGFSNMSLLAVEEGIDPNIEKD